MSVKDVQSYLRKDAMTIIGFFESINDKQLQIMKDVGRLSNFFDTYTGVQNYFLKWKVLDFSVGNPEGPSVFRTF